jgi:hypothetical protein
MKHCGMNYSMKNRTNTIPYEAVFTIVTNVHYTLLLTEITYVCKGLEPSDWLCQRFSLI